MYLNLHTSLHTANYAFCWLLLNVLPKHKFLPSARVEGGMKSGFRSSVIQYVALTVLKPEARTSSNQINSYILEDGLTAAKR